MAMTKRSNHIICLLLVGLLTACSTVPLNIEQQTQNQKQIKAQDHWLLKAKISITTEEDSLQAMLHWQQQQANFDFHVFGTFGITYAHLIQQPEQASLAIQDEPMRYHTNAQALMAESLGWDFPIQALSYWIKGLPAKLEGEQVFRDEFKQIKRVIYKQWQVDFPRYHSYQGYTLPRIIKAKHPQMTLKLAINKWNFAPDD
jgi:outer membrane lipoprotein LolB